MAWLGSIFFRIYGKPLEYEDTPDWNTAKHSIIKEEKSGAIDIIASLRKLISFGEKLGYGDLAFE